jgi:hypothetical protein
MRPEKAPAIEYMPLCIVSIAFVNARMQPTRKAQVETLNGIWDTKSTGRTEDYLVTSG